MNAPPPGGYIGLLLAKSEAAGAARYRQLNKSIMNEEETTKSEIAGLLPSMVQVARAKEHGAWTEVCKKLQALGVVTQADMEASQLQRQTPGQDLFYLIREWAKFRVVLNQVQALEEQSKFHIKDPQP